MEAYAFVCGVARSGTSALTRLLSHHKDIAIGMERFIEFAYPDKIARVNREAFASDKFSAISSDETHFVPVTNPQAQVYYDFLIAKYNTARIVGDKVPRYYRYCDHLLHEFTPCRIIFITRDITEVAHSWNVRAKNTEDPNWNANRDFRAAVKEWNYANATVLSHARQRQDAFIVVNHRDVFFDGGETLAKLCRFLGVPADDAQLRRSYERTAAEAVARQAKKREFATEETDFIESVADYGTWSQLLALSADRT